jgi:hypothetical protein
VTLLAITLPLFSYLVLGHLIILVAMITALCFGYWMNKKANLQ